MIAFPIDKVRLHFRGDNEAEVAVRVLCDLLEAQYVAVCHGDRMQTAIFNQMRGQLHKAERERDALADALDQTRKRVEVRTREEELELGAFSVQAGGKRVGTAVRAVLRHLPDSHQVLDNVRNGRFYLDLPDVGEATEKTEVQE